jgi:intracellular septation protein A
VNPLLLSISAVLLFGLLAILLANGQPKTWHALVYILFGYYLAQSSLGPMVQQLMNALLSSVS